MRLPPSSRNRVAAGAIILLCTALARRASAQEGSSLPPASPTSAISLPSGTVGSVEQRSGHTGRRAEITYTGGLLAIHAANSSLNAILREVASLTGMKITGGIQDDRVFGTYGPAPATQVLASLLDGTSSNILIVENAGAAPAELILTPRRGAPTPPDPNAEQEAEPDSQPQIQRPANAPGRYGSQSRFSGRGPVEPPGSRPLPPSNGGQTGTPVDGGANLGSTPGAFLGAGQTPPDATAQPNQQDTTNTPDSSQANPPAAPNTPQQIYEQLQHLRQQQQQPNNDPH